MIFLRATTILYYYVMNEKYFRENLISCLVLIGTLNFKCYNCCCSIDYLIITIKVKRFFHNMKSKIVGAAYKKYA